MSDADKFKFHAQIWKQNCINWEITANECKSDLIRVATNFEDAREAGSIIKRKYDGLNETAQDLTLKVKKKNKTIAVLTGIVAIETLILILNR